MFQKGFAMEYPPTFLCEETQHVGDIR